MHPVEALRRAADLATFHTWAQNLRWLASARRAHRRAFENRDWLLVDRLSDQIWDLEDMVRPNNHRYQRLPGYTYRPNPRARVIE